jgi:hypothetical protein
MRIFRWLAGGIAAAAALIGMLFWLSMAPRAVVEDLIQQVRAGERDAALSHFSEALLEHLGPETMWRMLSTQTHLGRVESLSFTGAGVRPGERDLHALLRFGDRPDRRLEVQLIHERGSWRINGFGDHPLGSETLDPLEPPGVSEGRALVQEVTRAFVESVERGDMQPVFALSSNDLRLEMSIAELNSRFAPLLSARPDVAWLLDASPELAGRPGTPAPGVITLEGRYLENGRGLLFEYHFIEQDDGWRLLSFSFTLT